MPTLVSILVIMLMAAPDDDDVAQRPGLLAQLSKPGFSTQRIIPTIVLDAVNGSLDPRLNQKDINAHIDGFLMIRRPGLYQFHPRCTGVAEIVLEIDGKKVATNQDVKLRFGMTSLTVKVTQFNAGSSFQSGSFVALDWSGPGFAPEPIPANVLFHDPRNEKPDHFEEGRRLADRLGCASCHAILNMPRHDTIGPPLPGLAAELDETWLTEWLVSPATKRPGTRMPNLGMSRDEAAKLATFLKGQTHSKFPAEDELRLAINIADPAKGRLLFRSLGCLGCHPSPGNPPLETPTPAPTLDHLAQAGDTLAVAAYLITPPRSKLPSKHRPNMQLTSDESAHIAKYLAPTSQPMIVNQYKATLHGRELFNKYRCANCHESPKFSEQKASVLLDHSSDPSRGCLTLQNSIVGVPRYDLRDNQRAALKEFIQGLPPTPSEYNGLASSVLADDTIRAKNCLGCHARDGAGRRWLGTQLADLLKDDPALGSLKGMLTPPDLTAVGDKLRPEYVAQTIAGAAPPARPWLTVRMPVFTFDAGESERLAQSLVARDHMPNDFKITASKPVHLDAAAETKAGQLLGQKGFGCVNCHVIAGRIPPGGEAETLGPDLALAHKRMTERYFTRWLADPQRIIEGTPMPRFIEPIRTVSNQSFEEQLASIWSLLGTDRAQRLSSEGLKERLARDGERALVVRDMIVDQRFPESAYRPRGIAIGLHNGHSLLFDAHRLTWVAHWQGGFLFRTKQGRLWEWHIEGAPVTVSKDLLSPIAFVHVDGRRTEPVEVRERFGSFRELEFTPKGVKLVYTLRWAEGKEVVVAESIEPTAKGWSRTVEATGLPEEITPTLRAFPANGSGSQVMQRIGPGVYRVILPQL